MAEHELVRGLTWASSELVRKADRRESLACIGAWWSSMAGWWLVPWREVRSTGHIACVENKVVQKLAKHR